MNLLEHHDEVRVDSEMTLLVRPPKIEAPKEIERERQFNPDKSNIVIQSVIFAEIPGIVG